MITTNQIRKRFVEFFMRQGHTQVPSSSLVPYDDPTLLFVNAGMVQFKDTFLGLEKRPYSRATSVQRCVRAGGKHNDLDNVGYTARHHTFFEMLGNFSFGDYFKREAISFAWTFLTEELALPKEKLWVTVFEEDHEAESIWLNDIGVDPNRFSRIGAKDNFWAMGDTGPCGPCTEIFYDHGESIAGGPPGTPDEDGDRFIEIWNLVFMQFNRKQDGTLEPLPKPSVDTGMGIERLAAVLQGVHDNYHIDLFQSLIQYMAKLAGATDLENRALRVIADHIRSCAFLITDGVRPSNEGRGYVLRRIMRRAIRYGHKLGLKEPFFYKMVKPLVKEMGEAYPELAAAENDVTTVILKEEEQFAKTLDQGMQILESAISDVTDAIIAGEVAFKLYDTYGFPVDLTADIARERALSVDMQGFEKCMAAQKERARSASQFKVDYHQLSQATGSSEFIGYEHCFETTEVDSIHVDGRPVQSIQAGEKGVVLLPITPFYAESGGQVGDQGILAFSDGQFVVEDTQKQGNLVLHIGYVKTGQLTVGMLVEAQVDLPKRLATARNHSATHLLHAALKKVLGEHVEQKGSLVAPDRLRFDFSHDAPLTSHQWLKIERLVNEEILENHKVITEMMSLEQAKTCGAVALFGEKYDENVRVLTMGPTSCELCGGTHVRRTGDIGLFKIILETGVSAGVRRVEAVTGKVAIELMQRNEQLIKGLSQTLKAPPEQLSDKLQQTFVKFKTLEKQLEQLQDQLSAYSSRELVNNAATINGIKVLVKKLTDIEPKSLKKLVDQLKEQLQSGVIVLGLEYENKAHLIVGVTKDLTGRFHAGKLVSQLAELIGGKGGGRADMAQAGGSEPQNLKQVLEAVPDLIKA